jgi:spore maturation protein CgeB
MNLNTIMSSECPREPRICMPTFSAFARQAFRSGLYEAQDVLAACDDVDLIQLKPSNGFPVRSRWMRRLVYHDLSRTLVSLNPGLQPVQLTRDYDLFMLVCPLWSDVWHANAVKGWRDHCRTSVCWIDELWSHDVPELRHWLPILNKFDYVAVGISGSGKALSDALGRRCYEIQGGVDTIRFCPYPKSPQRVIDFYSVGRRLEGIHRRLLKWASDEKLFYIHDTLDNSGDRDTLDRREHRDLYAHIAKRSRFFGVAPGKVNSPKEIRGQFDIGFRYFEGSAAGAVLVGQAPDCEPFRRHFDWPHAVVETQPDGSDTVEVISKLAAEPDRIHEISLRNVEEALRRHDWIYRWKEILRIAGLNPTPAMDAREKRLAELADRAKFEREKVPGVY